MNNKDRSKAGGSDERDANIAKIINEPLDSNSISEVRKRAKLLLERELSRWQVMKSLGNSGVHHSLIRQVMDDIQSEESPSGSNNNTYFIISYLPIITVCAFIFIFLIIHFDKNHSAEMEWLSSYNRVSPGAPFAEIILEDEMQTAVIDLSTSNRINETYYLKDDDGIIKINPDQIYRIKGSLGWRFFKSGIFKGERNTPFTIRNWNLGSKRLDGTPTSLLQRLRFDPTNLTPFYALLVLFTLSVVIMLIFKRMERDDLLRKNKL